VKAAECMIPLCPALVEDGRPFCEPHRLARTVEMLGIMKQKCGKCRRLFKKTDYVTALAPYRHIACEPKKSRIRHEGTPLLEIP
jgi:hypothetical protein